jgi:luciferase-like monooxygenase
MFQIDISLASIRDKILAWPGVTTHPHDFGGTEFRYRGAQIGHIHDGGAVHIPFTRLMHDELLAQGLASEHRWSPNSGWTSFQVDSDEDAKHALWLLRLSYLRYALKGAENANDILDRASNEMSLTLPMRSFLSSAAGFGAPN